MQFRIDNNLQIFSMGANLASSMSTSASVLEDLCSNLNSLQKTKESYVQKYGEVRFRKVNRQVFRTKIHNLIDIIAPSAPVDGKRFTRRKRRELASDLHNEVKNRAYQTLLPIVDEAIVQNPAEIIPFRPDEVRDAIRHRFCPELTKLEKDLGGINRTIFKMRILLGCDAG